VLIWLHLHDISDGVKRGLKVGEDARLECRGDQDINACGKLLLFGDSSADIPSVGATRGGHRRIAQARDAVRVRGQRKVIRVRSEHVHPDAAFELLRVSDVDAANELAGDSEPHHELGLILDVDLPSGILAVKSAVVGASTCIVLVPGA